MATRQKGIKDPPLAVGVPMHLVAFDDIAWPEPRPEAACHWSAQYWSAQRRTICGFHLEADADAFFEKLTSGAYSLFPANAERLSFTDRGEAERGLDALRKRSERPPEERLVAIPEGARPATA